MQAWMLVLLLENQIKDVVMRVVTAPDKANLQPYEICCFLAGGITDCKDWQNEVIKELENFDKTSNGQLDKLVLFNPRRDVFPNEPTAA